MAKPDAAEPLPETQPSITVEDFAARASATDKRVELLTAFAREEAGAGRGADTEAAFQARYAAFATRPAG